MREIGRIMWPDAIFWLFNAHPDLAKEFMNKPRLLMTCEAFPETLAQLSRFFEVDTNPDELTLSEADLIEKLRGTMAVITSVGCRITAHVLAHAPDLKIICAMTVGYDHIDVEACKKLGIMVTNAPDVLNESTADFAWALLLATARRVTEAHQWLHAGHWERPRMQALLGADVHGKTLGIFGMGRIGQAIARRSLGFDMQVIYHNRSRLTVEQERWSNHARYVSKQELLQQSDHLILMVPYSPETRHCMGEAEFALMRPTAILVNTSRGGVVDEAALIGALRGGQIAAAGVDVFENEPQLDPAWLTLPNVVLTPHIASATGPTRRAMQQVAVENLLRFHNDGSALNVVS